MKTLIQSLSNITFIFDLNENNFIYVHPSLSFLIKEKDSINHIASVLHKDDQKEVLNQFQSFMNGTFNGNCQFRIWHKSKIRWFRVTPQLIALRSENLIFGNAIDITAEVQNLGSIEKYANKKNSILHILTHELKGPLGLARNLSKDLHKRLGEESFVVSHLNLISRILSQSIHIIEDFTNREFLETVNVELIKKRINIVQKVEEYVAELKRAEEPAQRVFSLTSTDENIYIKIDEAKFMQVLNNLVSNSLKFTRSGGHISIHITNFRNKVIIDFKDNGVGIPERFLPLIFDEFTDARRKGLRGEATLGLGLSIVKAIVSWHKGRITVKSRENKGTVFSIELPKD